MAGKSVGNGPTVDTTAELAELLTHCSQRLRRGSSTQLAPLGLTNAQARVLRIVASAGRPLRMADIAARLEVVPRSVTTMVDGVEAAGLIARSADPDDRRSVLVSLTAGGQDLLERLDEARRLTADEIFGALSHDDRAELARLLEALCRRGGCSSCGGPPHVGRRSAPDHHHHRDARPRSDEEEG